MTFSVLLGQQNSFKQACTYNPQTHKIETTLLRRRCDVMTSHRYQHEVFLMSRAVGTGKNCTSRNKVCLVETDPD